MALLTTSAATLSGYIVAFAGAAKTAQQIMSSGTDPMVIQEFRFKANLTADFEINSTTDISLNIWRINLQQKLSTTFKESIGLEIECKLSPAWVISGSSDNKSSGNA